jgi:pilus assembly protein CpaB
MKWAVTGLCVLGVLAALCAAFLLSTLRGTAPVTVVSAKGQDVATPDVIILYATRAVPSMTVLDNSMVATKTVRNDEAPKGFISSPVGVVGKVLSKPVREGQPFTEAFFSQDRGPRQIADVIPKGKRAVGISVTDYAGLEELLYPGSIVDVLISLKSQPDSAGNGWWPATTKTLMQNIQVLAFDQLSVMSAPKVVTDANGRSGGARHVTLLVDPTQANTLQLAMEQGTLSLALRNPLDAANNDRDAVSIQQLLGDAVSPPKARVATDEVPKWGVEAMQAIATLKEMASRPTTRPAEAVVGPPKPPPNWEVTVIRGDSVETVAFPVPATVEPKLAAGIR